MKKPEILYDIIERLYGMTEADLRQIGVYVFARSKTLSKDGFEISYMCEYIDGWATEDERSFLLSFVYEYIKLGEQERAKANG